jgi:hypothetical protein
MNTAQDRVSQLLQGAIDIHVHPAPSLAPRSVDSWEALAQAAAAGMRGVLIKDHHVTTAPQAYIINRHAGFEGCRLYSSLCLNNAAGGLNPYAVEAAVRLGADIVYLPTFSAQNHLAFMARIPQSAKPAGSENRRAKPLTEAPIGLLGDDGRLKPVVRTIIDMVADAGIILGTPYPPGAPKYA